MILHQFPSLKNVLYYAVLIAFSTSLISCRKTINQTVTPAFYHWQTELHLTSFEKAYLDSVKAEKLYVKFFDVDWDESRQIPVPLAALQANPASIPNIEIIPTIFVTNRTLKNLEEPKIELLSSQIFQKIQDIQQQYYFKKFREIQIDCDWTKSTQSQYFQLLQHLKKETTPKNIQLSSTIRLHQVRYFEQTGIPPVDRGMLMCYNVGDLEAWETTNSILIPEEAIPYFSRLQQYPLPLDLALAVFSWGVIFRESRMIKLINNLQEKDLQDSSRFEKTRDNRYQVLKSTYLKGYYLYKGDMIRLEEIPLESLEKTVKHLKEEWPNNPFTLSFYHLDTTTIKRYSHEALEKICKTF